MMIMVIVIIMVVIVIMMLLHPITCSFFVILLTIVAFMTRMMVVLRVSCAANKHVEQGHGDETQPNGAPNPAATCATTRTQLLVLAVVVVHPNALRQQEFFTILNDVLGIQHVVAKGHGGVLGSLAAIAAADLFVLTALHRAILVVVTAWKRPSL